MSNEIQIVYEKTFETIRSTVNKMVDLIRPTFGPAGNKVIISKIPYAMVVDDGVQIARDFELSDPAENAVVKIIREAAVKTNDRVGDGTTSSLIILQAIINEVARYRKFDGRKIVAELKAGVRDLREGLLASSKQIKTREDLKKVAMICFDDKDISDMIADSYFKNGKDGIITIDKSSTMETIMESSAGTKLDVGYISPYMINNPERMETVFEKPYILITDYRLTENSDILPIMEKMAKEAKRPLVVIAENVEQHALATLVINLPQVMNPETRKLGTFPSVAINLPPVEDRKTLLEDLALLTGGKMFTESKGDKLENAQVADLGRCDRFICRREESIIIGPKGHRGEIKNAASHLRAAVEHETNDTRKKVLAYRLGMFTNTLSVIKVGAPTDNEYKALKYKVEDAVNAVKVAYRNGVVCGGGLALVRIKTLSPILNAALKYPAHQLCENMGFDNYAEYLDQNLNEKEAWNLVTDERGDFMKVGVMDPVDVLIAGVESAVSIASILLTSTGMEVEIPAKPTPQPTY